jgi:hypothetical protein
LIRDFDARGGWNNGFRSCAHWLAWRVALDLGAARERVRVARALGALPRLAQALAGGEVSYAKVRALTRVATPETEERLLAFAKAGTAEHVERLVRGWRRVDRNAENRETARRHASRALHVYRDEDSMVVIRGRLTPEVGAVLMQALSAARDQMYEQARLNDPAGDPPTMAQQQADALGLIAESALHHDLDPGARANGTRSSSTSMLRRSRTRTRLASRRWRTAHTFPRKRRDGWRATRAESSCDTTWTAA